MYLSCRLETKFTENWDGDYNPELGKFISEDPIGFWGLSYNLSSYVGNNPSNFTDPNGLQFLCGISRSCVRTGPGKGPQGGIPGFSPPGVSDAFPDPDGDGAIDPRRFSLPPKIEQPSIDPKPIFPDAGPLPLVPPINTNPPKGNGPEYRFPIPPSGPLAGPPVNDYSCPIKRS